MPTITITIAEDDNMYAIARELSVTHQISEASLDRARGALTNLVSVSNSMGVHFTAKGTIALMATAMDLDDVDVLAQPRRHDLSFDALLSTVRTAAMRASEEKPEQSLRELTTRLFTLQPADAATDTFDGWVRMGAVAGARAGWMGVLYIAPKDAPSGDHLVLYGWAWICACGVVQGVRYGR